MHPEVSIIVLVHETPLEAEDVLRSIRRHTSGAVELIVVDNGSGDETRAALEELARELDARLLRNDDNLAVAVAFNAAIESASGDEIVVASSDIVVTPGWLDNLRRALASQPDIAAVGPRSNSAHLAQGGIWLDDTSPAGIDRFAHSFNHPDPTRWFEVDWLVGFLMLIRRDAFDAVGGYDATMRTGSGADRELCLRLRDAGYRLICAGDTFVWHLGQRTYVRARINRTEMRFGLTAHAGNGRWSSDDGRLVRDDQGRVFELAAGVAHHIETATVLKLLRRGRKVEDDAGELEHATFGPPGFMCRERGTDRVWVVHRGLSYPVVGDYQRIRRLAGLSIADPASLEDLEIGPDLQVESVLPDVPEIPNLIAGPQPIDASRLTNEADVAATLDQALAARRGYAVVTLAEHDVVALNDGAWPLPNGAAPDPGIPARVIRNALLDADVVGVPLRRDVFTATPLLEQLLFHLDIYPPRLAKQSIATQIVPRLAEARVARLDAPTHGELDAAVQEIASTRDDIDAVVVSGDVVGAALCGRVARELELPAIHLPG